MVLSRLSLFSFIKRFVHGIDLLTEWTGKAISWATLAIVLLTFTIVVLRYGFGVGWVSMQESVLYFHGLIFMLGAGYTLKHDEHVRVDIFYQRFSERSKALVNLLGTVFLLFPIVIFIFWVSIDYVLLSWKIMENSKEPGGLPFVYLNKSMIIMLVLALGLQGLGEIGRNILTLLNTKEAK